MGIMLRGFQLNNASEHDGETIDMSSKVYRPTQSETLLPTMHLSELALALASNDSRHFGGVTPLTYAIVFMRGCSNQTLQDDQNWIGLTILGREQLFFIGDAKLLGMTINL